MRRAVFSTLCLLVLTAAACGIKGAPRAPLPTPDPVEASAPPVPPPAAPAAPATPAAQDTPAEVNDDRGRVPPSGPDAGCQSCRAD